MASDKECDKQHACPNCGFCPHCGRSNQPPVTPAPYPLPVPARPWPRPWGPYWSVIPPHPEVGYYGSANSSTAPESLKGAVIYC